MRRILAVGVPIWIILLTLIVGGALGVYFVSRGHLAFSEDRIVVPPTFPSEQVSIEDMRYGANTALTNPDVFARARQDLIDQHATFVDANLSSMLITVYENGTSTYVAPIRTKGKPGSWWETPAGLYQIRTKEKSHFSSFGKVNQPWSMSFQGNFFIHGWPTHPDGTPVPEGYSGGCIRLSDDVAKEVYDRVKVGTPVLVYEKSFTPDEFSYSARLPKLSATQYLVADMQNNYVFLSANATATLPLDGFKRFLVGLVAVEYINIEHELPTQSLSSSTLRRLDNPAHTRAFDLLALMLEESDSDPLVAFADRLGEKRIAGLITEKAKAIGMKNTQVGGGTTPMDLFYLMKYVTLNRKFLLQLSIGKLTGSAYDSPAIQSLTPTHPLVGEPGFLGGTFVTNSDGTQNSVGVFQVEVEGGKRNVSIFLGSSADMRSDTTAILEYISRTY